MTTTVTAAVDTELVHQANAIRDRAHSLRVQSGALPEVLAATYRRRASELELEAWLLEVTSGMPVDRIHPAA